MSIIDLILDFLGFTAADKAGDAVNKSKYKNIILVLVVLLIIGLLFYVNSVSEVKFF